jgi:hypothetical protein
MEFLDLIALASVRFGIDDRSLLWFDVHLGNFTSVSLCNRRDILADVKVVSSRSGSRSKFDLFFEEQELTRLLQWWTCWTHIRLHPHLARQLLGLRLHR